MFSVFFCVLTVLCGLINIFLEASTQCSHGSAFPGYSHCPIYHYSRIIPLSSVPTELLYIPLLLYFQDIYFHVCVCVGHICITSAGLIPASAMCVWSSPHTLGVSSRYSAFLHQVRDMHSRFVYIIHSV